MIRAMEQILGLPPMNQMDMAVEPTSMRHVFTHVPDYTPFTALANQIPIDELNPSLLAVSGLEREWALACEAMDFSRPDAADENMLNRAIWYSTKGFDVAYPGDERVLRPAEVKTYVEERRSAVRAGI